MTTREKSLNVEGITKLLWKSCFNLQLLVFKYTVFSMKIKKKKNRKRVLQHLVQ